MHIILFASGFDVWKTVFALVPAGVGWVGTSRLLRLRGCATCFLRAYAGAPVTRTLRPSLLRCGERPCDTLRALPENVAAPVRRVRGGFGGLRSDIRVPEAKRGRVPL